MNGLLIARVGFAALAFGLALYALFAVKPWEAMPAAGGKPSLSACIAWGSWWAAAVNAAIAGLLALSAPLWARGGDEGGRRGSVVTPRWFWAGVLVAVGACAVLTAPRLSNGFWDDEEYSVRRSIAGTCRIEKTGEAKFKFLDWKNTFYYYAKPNNHLLNSVLGRISNSAWVAAAKPEGLPYSEMAVRLPAFAAGLAAVGAAAWLCLVLGLPGTGVLAAWLLALHPWFCRFVPEARGYAFLFLLGPLVVGCGVLAIRHGGLFRWAVFGCVQFLMLASWAGAGFFLAVVNMCLLGALLFSGPGRWTGIFRLMAAGLVVLGLGLVIYGPCVPQFLLFARALDDLPMGAAWWRDVFSRFLTSLPWVVEGGSHPHAREIFSSQPFLSWGAASVAVGAVAAGILRLSLNSRDGFWIALALALPFPAFAGFCAARGVFLLEWYVVGALPGLVILAAAGLAGILGVVRNPAARGVLAVAVCAFFLVSNLPAFRAMAAHPVARIRESVRFTRPDPDPNAASNRSILTAAFLSVPQIYDPRAEKLASADDLRALMERARKEGRPLYLNQAYTGLSFLQFPGSREILLDPELFEHIRFPGIEPMFDRDVFRLKK